MCFASMPVDIGLFARNCMFPIHSDDGSPEGGIQRADRRFVQYAVLTFLLCPIALSWNSIDIAYIGFGLPRTCTRAAEGVSSRANSGL